MNIVFTKYNLHDEWWQDTYICHECGFEFMTDGHEVPRFCPKCGVKFDALRISTRNWETKSEDIETIFIKDEEVFFDDTKTE